MTPKRKMKKVVEASVAVAEAVKLCKPLVIPIYPITPQTHIVERIADMVSNGDMKSEMIHVESEHSAISAAVGASATGVRTFSATSSQGLALMHEILFVASGLRLPIVMAVANRALSAPINIWNDHSDSMAERDAGWIQIYVESSQEAHDSIIQMYKICEDRKVLLPGMVCLDGFSLSHVHEPVDLITGLKGFLPDYKHLYHLDPKNPMTFGPIATPKHYISFKKQQQDAIVGSLEIIKKVNSDFKKKFGRGYGNGLVEEYKTGDAQKIIVCMGTIASTAREVVDDLRAKGKKVGLLKIRCFRPFPKEDIIRICKKAKEICVVDKAVSYGNDGPLFIEMSDALRGSKVDLKGFIAGLGGRDVTKTHLESVFNLKGGWLM